MTETNFDEFKGKDCVFLAEWLKTKVLHKLCTVFESVKVHLTPKIFFTKIMKLIFRNNLTQKFFHLVKSLIFYAPSKPSFKRFTPTHGESVESKACDVKSGTNTSAVLVDSLN